MNRYIVDTFHDETKLFEEITSELRKRGVAAECVLDDLISVNAKNNTSDIIAEATGKYIINNLETDKVYEILKTICSGSEEVEGAAQCFKDDTFNKYSRLRVLKKELKEALRNYGRINVEGMLNFRLHEYNHLLYTDAAMAIEDYTASKAGEDFLNLLKYYVSIQDFGYDTVTVTQTGDDYLITDTNGIPVEYETDSEFFEDIEVSTSKAEDILIGRLIDIAPKKIIFIADENKAIVKTLKYIFKDRLCLQSAASEKGIN